jgi:signal transduction histidine kinase
MRSANEVLAAVSDECVGIDAENQRRILAPSFTTKEQGMGMNIGRSIVEAYGGRPWAVANGDFSTIFQFTLPAISDAAV